MTIVITGGEGSMAKMMTDYLFMYTVLNPNRFFLDVTDEAEVEKYMQAYGPDVLINCAGYIEPASIIKTSLKEWNKHFAVNITGAFLCSKYALLNGCKRIINIGSTSAFEGRANWGAYCASKVALISLTETLTAEGVEAYSLNPARTDTKMRARLFPDEDTKTLMTTGRLTSCVLDILDGKYRPGSHIVIGKDFLYALPARRFT